MLLYFFDKIKMKRVVTIKSGVLMKNNIVLLWAKYLKATLNILKAAHAVSSNIYSLSKVKFK